LGGADHRRDHCRLLARRIYEREALIQTTLWRKAGSLRAILQAGRLRPPGFTVDR